MVRRNVGKMVIMSTCMRIFLTMRIVNVSFIL